MDATETRPLTPAGRRIATAAEELFYERGITGVGVDLIAEHSGVTKRTLYNQFGSKDHLVAVYLAERDRRWRFLVQATVDACATPRDAVLAPFEALATWSETHTAAAPSSTPSPNSPTPHTRPTASPPPRNSGSSTSSKPWPPPRTAPPPPLARQLLLLHEGTLATQPLPLDTLTEATNLARTLIASATTQ